MPLRPRQPRRNALIHPAEGFRQPGPSHNRRQSGHLNHLMFNEKIAGYLQEIDDHLNHLVDCTKPDMQTLSGVAMHIQLKELRGLVYKLNSSLFMAAPKELTDEILKAKRMQKRD